jgi:hypothetical protein
VNIAVLVPTRDRPENAARLLNSWSQTCGLTETEMWLVLDRTSPRLKEYFELFRQMKWRPDVMPFIGVGNMVQRSNNAAKAVASHVDIVGWAADDNLFVTKDWDKHVAAEFESDPTLAMVDTNDLLVGDEKAGAFFVRASVVESLGYLFLPDCEHLYVDFAANELMKAAGAYRYREDIVIEHLHPYAKNDDGTRKAEWDEAYGEYNTPMQDSKDGRAFARWRRERFDDDVEKVKRGLGA